MRRRQHLLGGVGGGSSLKNNDGEWVIELEDFKALVSDLMIQGGYEADQES